MKSILQNLASVIGGEAAVRIANFAAVLFIARAYGKAVLGAYAVTLAVATVVIMFADSGLQTAAITRIAPQNTNRNQIIGQLTVCKTALLALAAVLLAVLAVWRNDASLFIAIGVWVTVRLILQSYSQLQMAILKAVSLARFIGIIQVLHSALLFIGIVVCFERGWSIFALLAWFTASQFLELLFATAVLYYHTFWPSWPHRVAFIATIKAAAPFGIAYGLANLIIRSDTIVLSAIVPITVLGAFSAANALLLIVYVSAWLFGSILLPEMVRLSRNPETLKSYANQWLRWVVLASVPFSLACCLLAPKAIVLLYGPKYAISGTLASVMVLACPLILLNSIYTTCTIAANSRATFLGMYAATAVATLVLDFVLGHAVGSVGVASAIVVREAGMLLGFRLLMTRSLSPAPTLELGAP
ncbi:MAG TPA: oligosaccharide flippase family protein [Candidatus Eremiobacteraceae bacterium]|nr:oligosaccharide flippase family protein [Candidatus Eremiobacteraceae bacterium]